MSVRRHLGQPPINGKIGTTNPRDSDRKWRHSTPGEERAQREIDAECRFSGGDVKKADASNVFMLRELAQGLTAVSTMRESHRPGACGVQALTRGLHRSAEGTF